MPTYINNTSDIVYDGTNMVQPGVTYTTYKILQDTQLTLQSDTPYYNPLLNAATISVLVAGPVQSYTTNLDSRTLQLTPTAGTPRVYINSQSNTPAMIMLDAVTLDNNSKIQTILVDNAGSVTCSLDIKEIA